MKRGITTGSYWFYRRRFDRSCMNMDVVLDRLVDGAVLQEAAMRLMKRYPCLKYTYVKSEDNTQYLLTENDRPFPVVKSPGFVSVEAPGSNAYLWSLGYLENHVYLSVFHGLCDGLGLAAVMTGLLSFYISALTGTPLPRDLADTLTAEPSGLEYADPFDYASPCEHTFPFRVPEALLLQPESADTYIPYRRQIILSTREVLSVSKQTEGNVSGILSLILARALEKMNGSAERSIVVKCPINLRPVLGCPETLQNCVSSIKYVYSQKLKKMPFPRQASCFKGMLLIQSSEETLMNSFYEWKFDVLRFNRDTSIEEKQAMFAVPEPMLPMVSYLGKLSLGEYDRFLKGIDVSLDIGGGIGIIALSLGDRLYLNLMLSEEKRSFVRDLTDALEALGITYQLV